jgi:tetratricopeptide (TPR) repeat protein
MNRELRYRKGDKIGGRYMVHQALAGGMGEVYLCLDLQEKIPLALKTFHARYLTNPKVHEYFKREAATWVALEKHPNIVRCFFMDKVENEPFLFLEWVAGEEGHGNDLRAWLNRRGALEPRRALELAIDVCRGLVHADKTKPGIVHCDIKPENVLVAQGRLAKVTDFGLARVVRGAGLGPPAVSAMTGRRRHVSSAGGTPPYMAPELWRGEVPDVRTDIYGTGCLVFELLAGHPPYEADTDQGQKRQHLTAPVPALSLPEGWGDRLNPVLARCLAKQREARYASASALVDELAEVYRYGCGQAPRPESEAEALTAASHDRFGYAYAKGLTAADHVNRAHTYYLLHHYAESLADADQAVSLDPQLAMAYINRGASYLELDRHAEALADYNEGLRLDPKRAASYIGRGSAYVGLGCYSEALADFDRALELDPKFADAYANRGMAHAVVQRYAEALADFDRALELDPNLSPIYDNRGNTYHDMSRDAEALADYNEALRLDPDSHKAYINRGKFHADLGRHAEALADLSRAVEICPSFAPGYSSRGAVYLELGRDPEALADISSAIQLGSTRAQVYFNRGLALARMGRHTEALADISEAIKLDPDDAGAYSLRGITNRAIGRYEEALADFRQALQRDSSLVDAHFGTGVVHSRRGDWAEALHAFEAAARLGDPRGHQSALWARQMLRDPFASASPDPATQALEAFRNAASAVAMSQAVERCPILVLPAFIALIQQSVADQVTPEHQAAFRQRLAWLRQIAERPRGR